MRCLENEHWMAIGNEVVLPIWSLGEWLKAWLVLPFIPSQLSFHTCLSVWYIFCVFLDFTFLNLSHFGKSLLILFFRFNKFSPPYLLYFFNNLQIVIQQHMRASENVPLLMFWRYSNFSEVGSKISFLRFLTFLIAETLFFWISQTATHPIFHFCSTIRSASIFIIRCVLIFVCFFQSFCLKMKSLMMYDE